jgi:NADPH:quinone reductase-like Zn-dependent oxidoreductase
MKAVRVNQWGQPVQVETVPQPRPANDEVLVRVHAVSLNPVDVSSAAGYLQTMQQLPLTLGTDFAGEVISTGSEVTHVKAGDAVYGMMPIRGGAFAEYAAPKLSEVARKPQSLNYDQASAVPLTALTAYQTLIDFANVRAGERVLVLGAAGNVGSFAVQLAKNSGATVYAVDTPGKESYLRDLGADTVIDGTAQRFEDTVGPVDIVLNFILGEGIEERAYSLLSQGGRYATTTGQPSQEAAAGRGIRALGAFTQPTTDHLTQLAQMFDAGKLKVTINTTFPLEQAQAALAYQMEKKSPGKVVLTL